jgi:hypothetical protein
VPSRDGHSAEIAARGHAPVPRAGGRRRRLPAEGGQGDIRRGSRCKLMILSELASGEIKLAIHDPFEPRAYNSHWRHPAPHVA